MKKRGFTLIELLAVIVVLAIIALIATPIVMNTIKNSKKGAAERGADNYIKQVETTIAEKRLENNPLSDGTYTIDENGNLTGNGLTEPITIEMNGTKPSSGSITISNGEVTTSSIIGFKDYEVKYNTTNKKYEATAKNNGSSDAPTVVYRWSTDTLNIDDTIDPNDTTKYTQDANTLGKEYYLKHVLDKDNKVVESYACAILNNKEYCLTSGEYGYAENESDYTGNVLKLKKLEDDGISCEFGEGPSICYGNHVSFYADPNGSMYVYFDGGAGGCYVYTYGGSYCGGN